MTEPLAEIVRRVVAFRQGLDPDELTVLPVEVEVDPDYWAPRPPTIVYLIKEER